MSGTDLTELVTLNADNTDEKWEARKERRKADITRRPEKPNYLRGVPNDWCQILKQQCGLCQVCYKTISNPLHMKTSHNIHLESYKELWRKIKDYYKEMEEKQKKKKQNGKKKTNKVERKVFLEYWKPRLKKIREDTQNKYNTLYNRNH